MNGSSPLRIVVLGRGRMGKSVKAAAESRGHEVIGLWGREEVAAADWPDADVAIDFTTPEAATGVFRACRERNLPLVSGTTGWLQYREEVEQAVKEAGHPMLWAPNFSVGIHLFRKALVAVQETLAESAWSIHVEEVHHTLKVDAPSGTALAIGEDLQGRGAPVVPIHAQRLPGVPGTHEVVWQNEVDRISLSHSAKNRSGFAKGAVLCAEWLVVQAPPFDKIHSMEDVWG